MDSFMLRKADTRIYIEYGLTHTQNLLATNIQVQTQPVVRLSLDLNSSLRAKNKQTNSYDDARSLAKGELARLKLVSISDSALLKRLADHLKVVDDPPDEWILTIELEGTHDFRVRPGFDSCGGRMLRLRVIGRCQSAVPECFGK